MSNAAMLMALGAAERLLCDGVDPRWAIGRAAELHAVDRDELALCVLQKLVSVQRARAHLSDIREGDRPVPAPAPKRRRVRRAI